MPTLVKPPPKTAGQPPQDDPASGEAACRRRLLTAARQKAKRKRDRDGRRVFRLSLDDDLVAAFAIDHLGLAEEETRDHRAVEDALAGWVSVTVRDFTLRK